MMEAGSVETLLQNIPFLATIHIVINNLMIGEEATDMIKNEWNKK